MAKDKSPISLLQELSIKQGFFPVYNYLDIKRDDISNKFVCRVECKKFSTEGTGTSKKDAKHNAAKNMLLLLAEENEIPSLITNKIQISSLIETCKSESSSRLESRSSPKHLINYVGMLQEFCVGNKLISTKDILYEVVEESGPSHLRNFMVEVSLGCLRERGSAQCKKIAKQEAAQKLLQRLKPNMNKLLEINKYNENCKEELEDTMRKLGVEISDCNISQPTLQLTTNQIKETQALYMKSVDKERKISRDKFSFKDFHNLFEKTYSSKISYNMRKEMQAARDLYNNHADIIIQVTKDITRTLGVKIEETSLPSLTKNCIISLRLLSHPIITELGIGKSKNEAKIKAMHNVIVTILTFLNIP